MDDTHVPYSVAYLRRQYEEIRDWYKTADTKAQALITLDGVFLAFVSSAMITNPTEVASAIGHFRWETWLFLIVMVCSLAGSIGAALWCLWSRGLQGRSKSETEVMARRGDARSGETCTRYRPEDTWFFGDVRNLENFDRFRELLLTATPLFESQVLVDQIWKLSRNVVMKHRWLNAGFVLAGCSLVALLCAAASYMWRMASD